MSSLIHRWSPRPDCYNRREVFIRNDGLREEPVTDERSARTAAAPGHQPSSPCCSWRQCSALLFIDWHTHHILHRLWSDVIHTHTANSLTDLKTNWCFASTKRNNKTALLCVVQPKQKIFYNINNSSSPQYCFLHEKVSKEN